MLVGVNLPSPWPETVELVSHTAQRYLEHYPIDQWPHSGTGPNTEKNCAAGVFSYDSDIDRQVKQQYSSHISIPFSGQIGILHNRQPGIIACYPPHTDYRRRTVLNFYVQPGGSHVSTVMYREHEPDFLKLSANIVTPEQLSHAGTYICTDTQWYALNVRHFHSVENLETTRVILALTLECDFQDFLTTHSELLVWPTGIEPVSPA